MKRKILVFVCALSIIFVSFQAKAYSYAEIRVKIDNQLSIPLEKEVELFLDLPSIKEGDGISVFDIDNNVPLEVLERNGEKVRIKILLSFKANEKKEIVIRYGPDIKGDYKYLFKPDFMGDYYVGYGSKMLYIISFAPENHIKVSDAKGIMLFEGELGFEEAKSIEIGDGIVFEIKSDKPILAEVSSLNLKEINKSSDDVSCVYGSHFTLFVPREIFICAYKDTQVKLTTLSGEVVFEGKLPERGVYSNLSLEPGFYTVDTSTPVTVEFGYSDDNVYNIFYGSINSFKGMSLGDIVYSSLYPDTEVIFKTKEEIFDKDILKNPGDYVRREVIRQFGSNSTEADPVYITFSKPILIYSNADSGNIGGEQIPSINGSDRNFIARTGKIVNFNEVVHKRKIIVVASEANTTVNCNGKSISLNALESASFEFGESFSLVNISSDKPVSVFEVGTDPSLEVFSILLPLNDTSTISTPVVLPVGGTEEPGEEAPNLVGRITLWFKNLFEQILSLDIGTKINGFFRTLGDQIIQLADRIIMLFIPLADLIQPYIGRYFPGISSEEISAALFFILIALVIIILIPKRRRKKIPSVPIEEVPKEPISFNVETIEEKETPPVITLEEPMPEKAGIKAEEMLTGRRLIGVEKEEELAEKPEVIEGVKEVTEEEKSPEVPAPEAVVPPSEEISTIEILLSRLKKEEEEKKKEKHGEEVAPEEVVPIPSAEIPVSKKVLKKPLEHSFVADAESLNRIFDELSSDDSSRQVLLSRVFLSANERDKLSFEANSNYRVGYIALTPIEERIAEDISRRINAHISTGEAILIARKIRANEIVVSDNPAITSYQGITIYRIEEVI